MQTASQDNLYRILREELLPAVQKPGQYLGNEFGAVQKDWDKAKSRIALIYPDLYELGMSNFGIKILYNIVNNHSEYLCDRAFAPMQDMEKLLSERKLPLWGWESYKPLNDFDMLGFSLGYELVYTNILTMLNLVRIPFLTKDRNLNHPLIFAGGPAVFNPEVMANYIDFYLIGDGEELIIEIQDVMLKAKAEMLLEYCEKNHIGFTKDDLENIQVGENYKLCNEQIKSLEQVPSLFESLSRKFEEDLSKKIRNQILFRLAQIKGVYVPGFYDASTNPPKPINVSDLNLEESFKEKILKENLSVPEKVQKRVVNLDDLNQPTLSPVPNISVVQDKLNLELRRGCDRGCRFCQPGYTYLPVRERSPEDLLRLSTEGLSKMGYQDYSLLSLSASDYTCLTEAARAMNDSHAGEGIALSMPSQRADRFNVNLAAEIQQVRKSGVTLAPEAGTERMRKIINKGLKQEEILRSITNVYKEGWSHVKLYFMIGLPFETDEDLDGILDILSWSVNMAWQIRKTNPAKYRKPLEITCTISTFVPKSFTPFQWYSQCSREEFARKHKYLLDALKTRRISREVKLNCTDPDLAAIESVLSRGNRPWGQVVREIWENGSRFDSWEENFNFARWNDAAKKFNLDIDEEATRARELGSDQPWDVLDLGLLKKFLVREWQLAESESETVPCTENKCHACGVCFELGVTNVVTKDLSNKNPYVTEIDIEKRKASCASLVTEKYNTETQEEYINDQRKRREENLDFDPQKILDEALSDLAQDKPGNSELTPKHPSSSEGRLIIVNNYESKQKLRLVITKSNDLRFIGNLDFQRLIERAIRRAKLPVTHTTGFNQHMKLSWGPALPLFIESKWEYFELDLAFRYDDPQKIKDILNNQLPKEARILIVEEISINEKTSINNIVESKYLASLIGKSNQKQTENLDQEILDKFLDKDEIIIEKTVKGKRRQSNIREKIISMTLVNPNQVELRLMGTQRTDEILNSLMPGQIWQVVKTNQVLA